MTPTTAARAAALAVSVVLLAACDKGCADRVTEMQNARTSPNGTGKGSLPLLGVDCPDGLARCAGGTVQASRLYSYSTPCSGTKEQCSCPWDNVRGCDRGCVVEDVEVVMKADHAALQLCAPRAADVLSAPPPADLVFTESLCDSASYRCSQGVVIHCGEGQAQRSPATPGALATCVRGCADEDTVVDDDAVDRDQAIALLCLHAPEPTDVPTLRKPPAAN